MSEDKKGVAVTVAVEDAISIEKDVDLSKVDEAMKLAIHNKEENIVIDDETDKKLLRKIDFYLLPVLCLLYCFQFMDKVSNSYASIMGLQTDLAMVGNMYTWTGTSFYLGYLFFEFPAVLLLQRFPVAKMVSLFIVLWGVILALHAVPQYAGFITLRTILGMLESSITPAFTIITSQWYTKEEQFLRVTIWFACNGLGIILGSGLAFGLYSHQDAYSIEAWKLVFIITGCLTICMGFVILFHIPDSPPKAWFLTEEEKLLVVERIRVNQQGFGNKTFKKYQFIEALTDYKTWLLFIFALADDIPNGGTTNFASILLTDSLGYTTKKALLMQMPSGAIEFAGCILFAFCHKYVKSRFFWATLGMSITLMAQCFLAFGSNTTLQFCGYTLAGIGPIGFICVLSLVASNVGGHTKKVTTNAIFLIGYCTGNLIGPQTFRSTDAPLYNKAKIGIVACGSVALVVLVLTWMAYIWENKKKEMLEDDGVENSEFLDLTDGENPKFRYST
ncbi:allantoate permease [[Candida] railenensis]|uniref:Allantoate permease n=1 Tax=[Candida] railenensis TaxID=45579 RepID=A0A9P0W028_9ASCO|nr:allantoate permease [[Candida] railenensis]